MARDLGEQNREEYARYKDDVKKEGKPFFPFAMLHDTIMGFVVVLVIIGLAVIWYYDADGSSRPGILGPWYTEPADPGTTDFIPRPDWYFYFLFYLLRIFEWPETVVIATVGIPTLLLDPPHRTAVLRSSPRAATVAPPGGDGRSRPHRPLDGRAHVEGRDRDEALGSRADRLVVPQEWAEEQGFAGNPRPTRRRELFADTGCLNCHTYLGHGAGNLGAPDLSESADRTTCRYFVHYLTNPAEFGNTVMGSTRISARRTSQRSAFLDASKGGESMP